MKIQLSKLPWQVRGFRPWYWFSRKGLVTTGPWEPDIAPIPAIIPGSAQTALRAAGQLPDWNIGTNSLLCQWVEHFQWEFFTQLPSINLNDGDKIILHCDGLDYSGWIAIDGNPIAEFRGALVRHQFDLTKHLSDAKPHQLSILFDLPPEEQGQAGRTTRSKFFKPRYSFSWDWTPRFVPIGIWDQLWLEVGPPRPDVIKVLPFLDENLQSGRVEIEIDSPESADIEISLTRSGKSIAHKKTGLIRGKQTISLTDLDVEPWFPNGYGNQPIYELTLQSGKEIVARRQIGFKHVQWHANPGAPDGAEKLLCTVNGVPIFLQGVNWTPIRMDYHDTPPAEYRKRINLYKQLGCTILRVWGGAFLEREIFYDLCDRAGLLVWQEFPLSSSTQDCETPKDPAAISDLEIIAATISAVALITPANFSGAAEMSFRSLPKTMASPSLPTIRASQP